MITVYKPQDFVMKFDNIWSAFEFIERNGYKVILDMTAEMVF